MWQQPELIGRAADLDYIYQTASTGCCCAVVGVSNLGKSALLRRLCTPSDPPGTGTFVYVDCNAMPERTPHALFTATWHAIVMALAGRNAPAELQAFAQTLYGHLIESHSPLSVALHYEEGIAHVLEGLPQPLVLCFDEFDEPYQTLEPQAFLNLRALKDRHGAALAYVTATERELSRFGRGREQSEFYELIAPRERFIHFWEPDEIRRFCDYFAAREQITFAAEDVAFVQAQAGGHPGLAQAVCFALGIVTGAPLRDPDQNRVIHQLVQQNLNSDDHVQGECAKIWGDLEEDERGALLQFIGGDPGYQGEPAAWRGLRNKQMVRQTPDGPVVFARVFAEYVRRRTVVQPNARGVYIDADAGKAWVNDRPIHDLTDLEYRLLLFLYGRLDRVCDKYAIVEAVWGQDYVDKVDDGRIEKLISRLRQKVEPDPTHPTHLLSLRGRGYKLVR